jgi:hypothetical protein
MAEHKCIRCGLEFIEKQHLKQHLKKKLICMPIEKNIDRLEQLAQLNKKEGILCNKCNRIYKNSNSLRMHNCKIKIKTEQTLYELKNQIHELKNIILELAKNPQIVNNIDNSTTNNTINITLNCLMDTTGKPIEYLLNQEDITDKILGWMKLNQKLISTYMKEKYYNTEHPENQMIRVGKTKDSIDLYIGGKWRDYDNVKGAGMILTNIGNDFGVFLEILKDNPELYTNKKKLVKQFEKDIIKPLNWGLETSEDSTENNTFQLIKNEKGEYVSDLEEEQRMKYLNIQNITIKEVHKII